MKQVPYVLVGLLLGALLGVYLASAQSNPATEITADYLMAHDSAGNQYKVNFGVPVVTPTPSDIPTIETTPLATATPGATAIPKPTETPSEQACQAKVIVTKINVRLLPDTGSQIVGTVVLNDLIGATAKYSNDGYDWFRMYFSPAVPDAWVAYRFGSTPYMEFDATLPACVGLPVVNPFP